MKLLSDSIRELVNLLNDNPNAWLHITESDQYSKELTDLFCDPDAGDFIALNGNIAYHIYRIQGKWEFVEAGKPQSIILDGDVWLHLQKQIPRIQWILMNEDLGIETQFESCFRDRISIIIDTAYANLE